jgi:hypothetical protein
MGKSFVPMFFECRWCLKIFSRGSRVSARYKCPYCRKYMYLWEIKRFFTSKRSGYRSYGFSEVKYDRDMNIVGNRIEIKIKFNDRE